MARRDPLADLDRLIPSIYAYVAYRVGDGPDAEDVTSDTIERALRYREGYDASKGDPMAWLIGIARNCISAMVSTRKRAHDPRAPDSEMSPQDVELETGRRLTLRDAVAGLDERERELIALRYGADLTARQIGTVLGLRPNAVEVALHRALARLRDELDREPSGELRPSTSRAVRF